jgi:hypothetical protein
MQRVLLPLSAAAFLLALGAGCGGPQTSVTQVWKAEVASPMRSVLVFGVGMDDTNRRAIEDAMAAELSKRHVAVKPSYELFPGTPSDRDAARKLVTQAGFEGVLVATQRKVTEKTTVLPGTYYGGFWNNYYGQAPWIDYDPGYVLTDEVVTFETTLWDERAGDRLVWSADLQTTNPSAGRKFATSLTESVMSKLEEGGLVPKPR